MDLKPKMYVPRAEKRFMLDNLERLGLKTYASYMNSKHWVALRQRLIKKSCDECGEDERKLSLHHMTYERLGSEEDEDLCTLCYTCHRRVHEAAEMSGSLFIRKTARHRVPSSVVFGSAEESQPVLDHEKRVLRKPSSKPKRKATKAARRKNRR